MRALALVVAAAVLTSVTGEAATRSHPSAATAPSRKPTTVSVKIEGMKFVPAEAMIHRGDTIVWTNADVVAHTVTSKAGLFDSQLIPPGGTWQYVARKPGDFDYKCSYHLPMAGKFTVR